MSVELEFLRTHPQIIGFVFFALVVLFCALKYRSLKDHEKKQVKQTAAIGLVCLLIGAAGGGFKGYEYGKNKASSFYAFTTYMEPQDIEAAKDMAALCTARGLCNQKKIDQRLGEIAAVKKIAAVLR